MSYQNVAWDVATSVLVPGFISRLIQMQKMQTTPMLIYIYANIIFSWYRESIGVSLIEWFINT